MLEAIHYDYKSKSDRKLRRDVKILYGEKYAEFFVRVIYAEGNNFKFIVCFLHLTCMA